MQSPGLCMNAVTQTSQTISLLEVIQLKWMLAGEGVYLHVERLIYLHVERLMTDAAYADRALKRAAESTSPTLRAMAARLRMRLPCLG